MNKTVFSIQTSWVFVSMPLWWGCPTRPLAVPCKSNAAKGASQLLTSWNLQDVAEGLQHQAGSCERWGLPCTQSQDGNWWCRSHSPWDRLPGSRTWPDFFLEGCLELVEGVSWHHDQLLEHHLGKEHRPVNVDEVRLLLREELCRRWFSICCDPNFLLARKRCTVKEGLSLSSSHHNKMAGGGGSLRGI